jgi:hypothetical protein
VSPGVEEAVSTAKGTTRAGDATATIMASAQTAPTPGPVSGWPSPATPPQVGPSPAAAGPAGPPGEATHRASGGRRSGAHSAARHGRSAHHYRQPARESLRRRLRSSGYCQQRWTTRTMRISPIPFNRSRRRKRGRGTLSTNSSHS